MLSHNSRNIEKLLKFERENEVESDDGPNKLW